MQHWCSSVLVSCILNGFPAVKLRIPPSIEAITLTTHQRARAAVCTFTHICRWPLPVIFHQYSHSPVSLFDPMMSRIKRRREKEGGLVLHTPLSYQAPSSSPQVPGLTVLVWQRGEGTPGRLFSLTLCRVRRHFPRLPRWMVTNSRGRGLCESCTVYQADSSWQTLWGRLKGELAAHDPAPKPAQVHCCR